jgi:hypothetical protein
MGVELLAINLSDPCGLAKRIAAPGPLTFVRKEIFI